MNWEIWKSDGTTSGTEQVLDTPLGSGFFDGPEWFTNVNGTLFFSWSDLAHGQEPWRSDGTTAGTALVADLLPGSGSSNPKELTDVNGTLFFVADNGGGGEELWKSDGTPEGTVLVAAGLDIYSLASFDGMLFFTADDGLHGVELWRSDGTAEGTVLVADIGPQSSSPEEITPLAGALFFRAYETVKGIEFWKMRFDADDDGLADDDEIALGTDRHDPDTDDDGLGDGDEVVTHGTDPLDADSDDDGLDDGTEVNVEGTDPLDADSDDDGLDDGVEVATHGTDPLDADTDDDAFTDSQEIGALTDPLDPGSLPGLDIVVDTTADEFTTNGNCSLREALRAADLDQVVDGCNAGWGFDFVIVPAGTYSLTLPGANESNGFTGDLDVSTSLAINGAGAASTILDATGLGDRVLHVAAHPVYPGPAPDVTVEIRNLTLRGGSGVGVGGALLIEKTGVLGDPSPVTLVEDCVFEASSAGAGGGVGIQHSEGGITTILRSAIRSNAATGAGAGGIDAAGGVGGVTVRDSTIEANAAAGAGAGGIASGTGFASMPSSMIIRRSTIAGNESTGDGPGGIHAEGTLSIGNSMISGNTGDGGGGVEVVDGLWGGNVSLQFATITDNDANEGGGIRADAFTTVSVLASIVAANTATTSPDVSGDFASSGDNLIGDGTGAIGFTAPGDQVGTGASPIDPALAALANNGGLTETHAFLAGSPAIDAADCLGVVEDQRASPRPVGPACDIGAYEGAAALPACSNGLDDDGDTLADYPADPGCASAADVDELGTALCDNGADDDGDGYADYPDDPGCKDATAASAELRQCQDGLNNDGDGLVDFDGGQSIHGACSGGSCPPGVSDPNADGVADPDPQCVGKPYRNKEVAGSGSCGLGAELALLLAALEARTRIRRRRCVE